MKTNEELIKEYVLGKRELFKVTGVGTYRDGGTMELKTNNPDLKFFIDHINFNVYEKYPHRTQNNAEIFDDALIAYLMSQVVRYKDSLEHSVRVLTKIYEKVGA